ncbi:bifunctional DNA-formamidopyrimidine glycosylase/DNA-(apurinic or apyrimidinic site) lyase [Candidatus Desantisbacteria bacterium]|nr:bifunctional DNA-formamidopyrimidine glycosylase/DNA-(apurinic or apyrimidinic site) lyase [Candidatus Desantisbacteria bacterium]
MPELPEVETIVCGLQKKIAWKKIVDVRVMLPRIIRGDAGDFIAMATGTTIQKVWRRGKMIVIDLCEGKSLLVHLKMTGQLLYLSGNAPVAKHTHLILELSDGHQLRYLDMRQFGYLCLTDASMVQGLTPSGAEPLEISWGEFKGLIQSRKAQVKPLLLNQSFLAGIGNIYADEILHKAGIHPLQRSHTLCESQITRLYYVMREVLRQAIEQRGSSISDFVDSAGQKGNYQKYHRVYQWQGEPCFTCQEKIVRIKIGGRSSYFCPCCQKNKGEAMQRSCVEYSCCEFFPLTNRKK